MELNRTDKNQKRVKDYKAFQTEEQNQTSIDIDSASKGTEDDSNNSEEQNKRVPTCLEKKMEAFYAYLAEHKDLIHLVMCLILASGLVAIVIAACILNFQRAVGLLVISLVTLFFLVWDWMMQHYGDWIWEKLDPVRELLNRNWFWIRCMMYLLLLIAIVCWLILDTAKQGTCQLRSFAGLLLFVFLTLLFSKHPFRWCRQTLLGGIGLQFAFGLLILRTTFGLAAAQWLGKQTEIFLSYTDKGSRFVFGETYTEHFIVFKVMPMLIFMSTVISILYYVGFMQWLILKIGFIMQVTMETSPTESMAAAGNIFLGPIESPLLIRPYISRLTCSELHAVMTGGFASIAGTLLGAYISFGIEATHLLTASVMSAPASLAIAKAAWPETETASITTKEDLKMDKGESNSLLEAVSHGAVNAVALVGNIIANLIAFIALLAFMDATLSWLGGMLEYPQLSFSLICSYVFMPLSFMMGISWEDSLIVGELIGIKTFLNEFVAYEKLSHLIKKRKAGGPEYVDNIKQYISVHSETISTYALCGFANFASLGITIGGLTTLAPERQTDISACSLRALISGTASCFMTACIAGMLYVPEFHCQNFLNSEFHKASVTNSSAQLVTCCTQLYHSVTVYEPWNITVGEGFGHSSLQGCCAFAPSAHFNCSLVL